MSGINRLDLTARLLQREALRYSPGGVAICQALLEHESTQPEMGSSRLVHLVMAARFSGAMAEQIVSEPLGSSVHVRGFLCPRRMFRDGKPSGALQIHVTQFRREPDQPDT